jgi:hypothetical protein
MSSSSAGLIFANDKTTFDIRTANLIPRPRFLRRTMRNHVEGTFFSSLFLSFFVFVFLFFWIRRFANLMEIGRGKAGEISKYLKPPALHNN